MRKIFFAFISLTLFLSSCSLSIRRIEAFFTAQDAHEIFERLPVEIVAGYELAKLKDKNGFTVTSPSKRAPDDIYEAGILASEIRRIGWNKNFIVVEEQEKTQKVWKTIVVKTEFVYYCAEKAEIDKCKSYDEFKFLRTQVGVPDNIEFRDVVDVYEELNNNK